MIVFFERDFFLISDFFFTREIFVSHSGALDWGRGYDCVFSSENFSYMRDFFFSYTPGHLIGVDP
jgi:hypothetical protein